MLKAGDVRNSMLINVRFDKMGPVDTSEVALERVDQIMGGYVKI